MNDWWNGGDLTLGWKNAEELVIPEQPKALRNVGQTTHPIGFCDQDSNQNKEESPALAPDECPKCHRRSVFRLCQFCCVEVGKPVCE